jgi:2-polyprenyl-3-methyl-5-hydroxy-6-metoxy-1,4-benzoquinol methylase
MTSTELDRYGFTRDPESRRMRGRRVVAALADFGGLDVAGARILDVGCSAGLMTHEIGRAAAFVAGVDVDEDSLHFAAAADGPACFARAEGARLPFRDRSFDAVVCNHVYEHVPDAQALMSEIRRVLRDGGLCYFAAGHTLQLIEPHHRLPLLSCLPRRLADTWLRVSGKGERYEERFLPPWRLATLFEGFGSAQFVSPRMLQHPGRYGFPRLARLPAWLRAALGVASTLAARAAPTWIYLLRR